MNIFSSIKMYIKLARPNMFVWLFHFLCYVGIYLLSLYAAIPSAKAITSITVLDLNGTIFWLLVTLGIIVVQRILYFIKDRLYYVNMRKTYLTAHGKIYDKLNHASTQSFAKTGKEKILNIIYNNIGIFADFPEYSSLYASYFVQAVVSIVILLTYNFYIGSVIIVMCVIIFFLANFANKRIALYNDKMQEYKDYALEDISDSINNRELTKDLNLNSQIKQKFMANMEKSCDYKTRCGKYYSFTYNWIPFIYQAIIVLCCIYMVILTKSNIFTLTLYLVLSKYLTKAITQMVGSYTIMDYVQDLYVSTLRIKNILDMDQDDIMEYGNNLVDDVSGSLVFTNVSYLGKDEEIASHIDKFNLKINPKSCNLIYGAHGSGKRAIFYMLRRAVRPTTGTITLDNINIFDFDKETFRHNITYTTSKPYFYSDTIMNNMLTSGASKQQVYKVCKDLGLHDKIVKTQLAYKSNLVKEPELFTDYDKYLLGIARAICTNSEVIMIYETPKTLSDNQKKELLDIFKKIGKEHTLILFSYADWLKPICKNICFAEKGTLHNKQNSK